MLKIVFGQLMLPTCIALAVVGCSTQSERARDEMEAVEDLPAGWGTCEGNLTFSLVDTGNGKLAFNPWGELSRGSGKLVWKDTQGNLHSFVFSDVDMCSVPGRSGWQSVKPAIQVSARERVVLLNADPSKVGTPYVGPVMVMQYFDSQFQQKADAPK